MLLAFRVANFLSIKQEQELSLVAATIRGPEGNVRQNSKVGLGILPAAIIYGANASGKSNLLKAFATFRTIILNSHRVSDDAVTIPYSPFRLDQKCIERPTLFEADFISDEIRYTYGFEHNAKSIVKEWLYSYPVGRKRVLFERKDNFVEFGSNFSGSKQSLLQFLKKNALFLSVASQSDHEEVVDVTKFFRKVRFQKDFEISDHTLNRAFRNQKIDPRAIRVLDILETGVSTFRQKEEDLPEDKTEFGKKLYDLFKEAFPSDGFESMAPEQKRYFLELGHKSEHGEFVYLDLSEESAGTRRLLLVLNSIFETLDDGGLLLLDEVDASLHTKAALELVRLFCDERSNPGGAQVVATTHDTNLIGARFLRRDQIWFAEKSPAGESAFFSLAEMKSRVGDNFEKGYLQGRYGAIPFAGDLVTLMGLDDAAA